MKTLIAFLLLTASITAQPFMESKMAASAKPEGGGSGGSSSFPSPITVWNTRTVGGGGNSYGITMNATLSGSGHDYLAWGILSNTVNNAAALPCSASSNCGVGFIEGAVSKVFNQGTAHEIDGVSSYILQATPSAMTNWVKSFNANLQISSGLWNTAMLFGVTHLEITPGSVNYLYGIQLPDITAGSVDNCSICTGLGKVRFGDVLQAQGYKSSDGSQGVTVTTCTSFKNGLCVAGTL